MSDETCALEWAFARDERILSNVRARGHRRQHTGNDIRYRGAFAVDRHPCDTVLPRPRDRARQLLHEIGFKRNRSVPGGELGGGGPTSDHPARRHVNNVDMANVARI